MKCMACGCWVEIEEPNPTNLGAFLCDECLEQGAAAPRDDWEEHGDGR